MKNSKEYSKKIQNLFRSLKREYPKVHRVTHDDVVEAIVYGIICEKFDESVTEAAIKRFNEYFVDMNDLRVSRPEEIAEMLSVNVGQAMGVPQALNTVLQAIFDKYHRMSLDALKKLGKRQFRQSLEKIQGLSSFVIDYCMLASLGGHAVPINEKMIEYLKSNELVDANADRKTIEGFLTKQISAKDGYDFYVLLRQESEQGRLIKPDTVGETKTENVKKQKKTVKRAVKKKTVKKTVKKTTKAKISRKKKTK